MTPRRAAFYIFVLSVLVNAGLGIAALFTGEFGDTQQKVLLTSLSVSAGTLLALASLPARERRQLDGVPAASMTAGVAGFTLLIVAVWEGFDLDPLIKTAATLIVASTAGSYSNLMAIVPLSERFTNIRLAAYVLAGVLAALIAGALWAEPDSEWYARVVGLFSILLAAVTVLVPVLWRVSAGEAAAAGDAIGRKTEYCPSCGSKLERSPAGGDATCAHCGAAFSVRFRS